MDKEKLEKLKRMKIYAQPSKLICKCGYTFVIERKEDRMYCLNTECEFYEVNFYIPKLEIHLRNQ